MLMDWLLKHEGYPPGVLFALVIHGVLLYFLLPKEMLSEEFLRVQPPSISATVITENPQRVRQQELQQQTARQQQQQAEARRLEEQRIARETAARQEQAKQEAAKQEAAKQEAAKQEAAKQEAAKQALAKQEAAKQEAAKQEAAKQEAAKQEAAKQEAAKREQEKLARETAERQAKEREAQLARAAQEEAARQAAAEAAEAEAALASTDLVSQYSAIIRTLISDNWNLPGNARNGMTVVLNIQLARNGEVVAASVIKSSGDAAFDRSAEQAVGRVRSFPELRDLPTQIFERNFRNFNLEFRPEDLLR